VNQDYQPDARDGRPGAAGVARGVRIPLKPGNAGGGKGLVQDRRKTWWRDLEIGHPNNSETCQKLQMRLHANKRRQKRLCFYALYDKISREKFWQTCLWPMPAPTRAHRAWTTGLWRHRKRMGGSVVADCRLSLMEETYRRGAYHIPCHTEGPTGTSGPLGHLDLAFSGCLHDCSDSGCWNRIFEVRPSTVNLRTTGARAQRPSGPL